MATKYKKNKSARTRKKKTKVLEAISSILFGTPRFATLIVMLLLIMGLVVLIFLIETGAPTMGILYNFPSVARFINHLYQ